MKTITLLLSILALSFSLSAADTPAKKESPAKSKASAAEAAKPSAKAEALAKTLTAPQKTKLLTLLNEGDDAALMALPGVGEVRATAIKKGRPFADVINVLSVKGIGEGTFAEMVAHAKADFPQPEKKAAKPAPKKKDSKESK